MRELSSFPMRMGPSSGRVYSEIVAPNLRAVVEKVESVRGGMARSAGQSESFRVL